MYQENCSAKFKLTVEVNKGRRRYIDIGRPFCHRLLSKKAKRTCINQPQDASKSFPDMLTVEEPVARSAPIPHLPYGKRSCTEIWKQACRHTLSGYRELPIRNESILVDR